MNFSHDKYQVLLTNRYHMIAKVAINKNYKRVMVANNVHVQQSYYITILILYNKNKKNKLKMCVNNNLIRVC